MYGNTLFVKVTRQSTLLEFNLERIIKLIKTISIKVMEYVRMSKPKSMQTRSGWVTTGKKLH